MGFNLNYANSAVIIDDVITSGGTKYELLELLKKNFQDLEIDALVIGVDREEQAMDRDGQSQAKAFTLDTGIPVYALTTKSSVLKYNLKNN